MRDTPSDKSNEQRDPSGQMYVTAGNILPLGLPVVIFLIMRANDLSQLIPPLFFLEVNKFFIKPYCTL
jgi:hypothetical protein